MSVLKTLCNLIKPISDTDVAKALTSSKSVSILKPNNVRRHLKLYF